MRITSSTPKLAEIIASSFCKVSNDLPPLQFDKAPVDGVPDEFIITNHHVEAELEMICLHKAPGPDDIPNWDLKTCAPNLLYLQYEHQTRICSCNLKMC